MARGNVALLSFNRGLVSPKALARVDLDRTRLSAEKMVNWIPSTQGSMRIRPGTKYLGSSYSDSGAQFLEFVASVNDKALIELTHNRARIWLPSDTGNYLGDTGGIFETPTIAGLDVLLARPKVATTVTLSDTGWSDSSVGGTFTVASSTADLIPKMTGYTTNGVTVAASGEFGGQLAWYAADDVTPSGGWYATGASATWRIDFGSGNTERVRQYTVQAVGLPSAAPKTWTFQRSDDGAVWVTEDTRAAETGWSNYQTRTYTLPGSDTGTVEARRYWRLNVTANNGYARLAVEEVQFRDIQTVSRTTFNAGSLTLNALATGSIAKAIKQVVVDTGDVDVEHGLAVAIRRGPITIRVGSTSGDDDYIRETELGTGYHNLAFVPSGNFHITFQTDQQVNRIVDSLAVSDSGTVEITTPWTADDLNVRYDQSADVVYVARDSIKPQKIERRGDGRSWSVVDYAPINGPFRGINVKPVKLDLSQTYGNTTLTSDTPVFRETHTGALFRLTYQGQSGTWFLGNKGAATDVIEMTGFNDTGVTAQDTGQAPGLERQIRFKLSGTYTGKVTIQRSFDGPDIGFHDADLADTGTATIWVHDNDNNITVWYRAIIKEPDYTSGVAQVAAYYFNGIRTSVCRITAFNDNQSVNVEVLQRAADTGPTADWEEGVWSEYRGFPQAPALHEGRLALASKAQVNISVADDFENFDDTVSGESAPISRTLATGSVDNINFLISIIRLVVGTAGAEISVRSSSTDEPLTATNSTAKSFSTLGSSANTRAIVIDSRGIYIHRSGQHAYMVSFGTSAETFGDFESRELTVLVPELLKAGVVSIAVQRQPDTRIHCVLADGTVAILTFEAQEEVLCWSTWQGDTGTGAAVERAMVLPGLGEDQVYYHVRRTINGATKRYLERWAMESECEGDTGLSWLADCAKSFTATTTATDIQGFDHLIGTSIIAWASDTGLTNGTTGGKDLSPDVNGVQTEYTVDTGGNITAPFPVHHVVGGLPYIADFKSTKLAYAAQAGTALAQMKKTDKIAFILHQTHNNALFFGNDTGGEGLDPMPRNIDGDSTVDADKVFEFFDQVAMTFPGLWDTDSRIYLRAKAPRPVTVMAAIPNVQTNERT